MVVGEALPKSQSQQFNKKLNKFGKMLGNKLFGFESALENELTTNKLPELKPPSLELSPSTKYFLAQEENLANFSNSKNETNVSKVTLTQPTSASSIFENNLEEPKNDLLIEIDDSTSAAKTSSPNQASSAELHPIASLASLFNNLQNTLIPIGSSISNNKNYVPKLSQKQYTNRLEKLNDINELIKDSNAKFLFI